MTSDPRDSDESQEAGILRQDHHHRRVRPGSIRTEAAPGWAAYIGWIEDCAGSLPGVSDAEAAEACGPGSIGASHGRGRAQPEQGPGALRDHHGRHARSLRGSRQARDHRDGVRFERIPRAALRAHPPRGRDRHRRHADHRGRPRGGSGQRRDGAPCDGRVHHRGDHLYSQEQGDDRNKIRLSAQLSASGCTIAYTAMAGGATDPDIQTALDAVFPGQFHVVAAWDTTAEILANLKTHLEAVSSPTEQRPGRAFCGIAGVAKAVAAQVTLATGVNHELVSPVYYPGSLLQPCELSAIVLGCRGCRDRSVAALRRSRASWRGCGR